MLSISEHCGIRESDNLVILELDGLGLTVNGNKILDNLNISIERGKVHAIVGPNGAGKSSLAFSVMGLEGYQDVEGDIFYDGDSIVDESVYERARRGITLAWQEPARYEGLTVRQLIGASEKENNDDNEIRGAIERVGMDPDDYLERAVDTGLSGGERKKIELASILAMEPELVLLDEPDSGIDVASLDRIFEGIELLKNQGSTVILITHSATVLEQAEYAFLMCCGAVVDRGSADKISDYFETKCVPCQHKNELELSEEG